jgi:hypothetical protein
VLAGASPVPLRLMTAVGFVVALLVIRIEPLTGPAVVGSNVTCSVAVCPGFSVTGKVAPPRVKPVPVNAAELIVSAAVPDEVTVTVWLVEVFRLTFPKERLFVLRLIATVCGLSCREKTFEVPLEVAVNVAVWVEVTADTVAVKPALWAPAGTVTEAGTATEELLLARDTTRPPVGAAALNDTVHASVVAPVMVPLAHESPVNCPAADCPVPLRLITCVPLVVALLTTVMEPVASPVVVGSNLTCSVSVCPAFRVTGKVAPDIEKPVPVSVPALMVSGEVPDDVNVTDSVVGVLTVTSPKLSAFVLTLRAGEFASSWSA